MIMSCAWIYFTVSEHLTVYYGNEPAEMAVFYSKFGGRYAPWFWGMVVTCFVIPMAILVRKRTRTIVGTVIASISVCIGMWIERFTIVVPTLESPRLYDPATEYVPTWVELSLFAGAVSTFILLYMLFTKLFPIIALWEIREGREEAADVAATRIREYFPTPKRVREISGVGRGP
jgi:molybdopterin-containing oxidoreductase family membrane subunit